MHQGKKLGRHLIYQKTIRELQSSHIIQRIWLGHVRLKPSLIGVGRMKAMERSILMEMLSQIKIKYDKHYFGLKDKIEKGTKVVYMPDHGAFIYMYYEGDYVRFKLKPGDIMTVKLVRKDEPCNCVYVCEDNKGVFSPSELLPAGIVDKEDIKKVSAFFKEYVKANKL